MRIHAALVLALLAPCFATAEDDLLSKAFPACMKESDGGDSAMQDCVIKETEVQDRKLRADVKRLGLLLSPARKQQLLEAHRLWTKYVDAHATLLADPNGGTVAKLDAALWTMTATAERARELDYLAAFLEGAGVPPRPVKPKRFLWPAS